MARKSRTRQVRNKALILTNRLSTEKNYFNYLKKHFKSIYTITIQALNADLVKLVDYAIKVADEHNQIWCVFDVDEFHVQNKILPAIQKSKKFDNIYIGLSNVSFEVWLIHHFEEVRIALSKSNYEQHLTKLLNQRGYMTSYDKTNDKLLEQCFIKEVKVATTNAKVNYQKLELDHRNQKNDRTIDFPYWEYQPITTLYRLIETLKFKI